MGEPARTSKSMKQLSNEAYALSGYMRNNPSDENALTLLENTVQEMKQLQQAMNAPGVNRCPSDSNYACNKGGIKKVFYCGSMSDYVKQPTTHER